jgi:pyrroloquinoline-quinone synthase
MPRLTRAFIGHRAIGGEGRIARATNAQRMNTLQSQSFRSEVRGVVAERHLLKHPFYVAWSQGALTLDDLRCYARQYMHYVLAEPTYLSAVHSNTPHFTSDGRADLRPRQAILRNLVDEELGPRNHPELWRRFARALGLSETDLAGALPLPSTRRLIDTFASICRRRPYYAGLAALHAFESQVPEIAAVKIDGLRRFYGMTDPGDYEFFTVHQEADIAHSGAEWQLIEEAAVDGQQRAEVVATTREACEALWQFLDGVGEDLAKATPAGH